MIAEIVAIGTELLMGQIADSDAQMLSRELQSLGIAVYHHQVVGDNPQRMREALALALSRSDLVITTGGLGPTQDDLSKEIAAELLGLPMEFDPESKNGKIIAAMMDLLEEMAATVVEHDDAVADIADLRKDMG